MECGGVGVVGGFPILFGWRIVICSPFLSFFHSTPSNSWVPSAVVGSSPARCLTSFTLLLHYLQEWTEVSELVWCAPGGDRSSVWLGSDMGFHSLWVDFCCFCHLGFQYAIALVSCTHDVSQTIQCHMISKKKKKKYTAQIEWWYFRVNRIRTHGVTVLRHLGIFAGTSSEAQGMSADKG